MMIERLDLYKRKNKDRLPKHVLVYRGGVSEVYRCRHIFLPISFVAGPIQAHPRERTSPNREDFLRSLINLGSRFYPTSADQATIDRNPLPGTVVDRGVTAVYNFYFFLQGTLCRCMYLWLTPEVKRTETCGELLDLRTIMLFMMRSDSTRTDFRG
ncbi:hypothetical protein SCLCIDRAFT_1214666 [Scleroderma citrinum Foug A]|uniref:Piwi domain-containing protein n=1 Tax=Scleroderma citrinum Foug A TaxID=1036808 RepID=A0A0C3E310_9AGAM|nr:hypothetical protein SCLCIDRAFT_1214666 [Scleroderma citrinum Foug A]